MELNVTIKRDNLKKNYKVLNLRKPQNVVKSFDYE